MSDEHDDPSHRGRTRPRREHRPTGKRVDPAKFVADMYERYPLVMEHLHDAEQEDLPSSSMH